MNRFTVFALFSLLSIASGCRRSSRGTTDNQSDASVTNDAMSQSADVNLDEHPSSPNSPRFLSFATNRTQVQVGSSVVFTAVLTDPQGIDNLIGGSLTDTESGAEYGAFQTSSSEGAYQITLTWADLEAVRVPHANASSSLSRVFTARFFDAEGNYNTRAIVLELGCFEHGSDDLLCSGECENANDNDTCGACDNACGVDGRCDNRACIDTTPRIVSSSFTTERYDYDGSYRLRVAAEVDCLGQDCVLYFRPSGASSDADWQLSWSSGDPAHRTMVVRPENIPGLEAFTRGCQPSEAVMEGVFTITWERRDGSDDHLDLGVEATVACPSGMMLDADDLCVTRPSSCDPPSPLPDAGVPDSSTRDAASVTDLASLCAGAPAVSMVGSAVFSGSSSSYSNVARADCSHAGNDAVVRWRAPYSGAFVFDTNGSGYDTILVMYNSDCSDTIFISCDDDSGGGGGASKLTASISAGDEVMLVIDGYNESSSGSFVLNVSDY